MTTLLLKFDEPSQSIFDTVASKSLDSLWFQKQRLCWGVKASAGIQLVDLLVHELKEEEKIVILPIVRLF